MTERIISEYGAIADGRTVSTASIQDAIDAAAAAGGGRVVVPAGHWRSGALVLRSRVELHLAAGARLQALGGPGDFPVICPTPHGNLPGVIRAFIHADRAVDVAITGRGTLHGDGNSPLWGNDVLKPEAAFRPALVFLRDCQAVRLSDVRLHYSQFWTCHLLRCVDVDIARIDIRTHPRRINADGIDPDGCRNVRVADCHVDSTDDALCIKSTEGDPCEDIVAVNCVFTSRCAAVKCGTEAMGPIRRVRVTHCSVLESNIGFALYQKDGSVYEDIAVSDCAFGTHGDFAVLIDSYPRYASRPAYGSIRGVVMADCRFSGPGRVLLRSVRPGLVSELTFRRCTFRLSGATDIARACTPAGARRIEVDPAEPDDAPRPFHFIATGVRGLELDAVHVIDGRGQAADRGFAYLRGCSGVRGAWSMRATGEPPRGWLADEASDGVELTRSEVGTGEP